MNIIKFDPVDQEKLEAEYANVAHDWADSLDKRRKPGTDTLSAVKKALEENK